MANNNMISNLMSCPRVCDLFPVDLGVDLQALQPEITQCKRRFQKDLWNTICNRVLQEKSGWKKGDSKEGSKEGSKSKSEDNKGEKSEEEGEKTEEEPPKEEEEEKPEESGENENNAMMMMAGGGRSSFGNWSNSGGGRMSRQQRPFQLQQPQQFARRNQPQPSPMLRRGSSNSRGGQYRPTGQTVRHLPLTQPPQQKQQQQRQHQPRPTSGQRQQRRPQQQQQQQQQQLQQLQPQQQRQRMAGDGELSNFLSSMRPHEGVLDWRDGTCPRLQLQRQVGQEPLNSSHARSYSATSRREILGCYDNEAGMVGAAEDEIVDVSEAMEDAKVYYGAAGTGLGQSDAETATYYMAGGPSANNRCNDGATDSTLVSREFVPLMVGNWWGVPTRNMPM